MTDPRAELIAARIARWPEETLNFMERLRREDIELLEESISFMRSTKTMSRFVKGSFVTVFGTILAVGSLIKGWQWLLEWLRGIKS